MLGSATARVVRAGAAAPARRPARRRGDRALRSRRERDRGRGRGGGRRRGRRGRRRQAGARGRHDAERDPGGAPRRVEHVAAFAYPESAARALGRAAERAEWLRRPQGAVPTLDGIDRRRAPRRSSSGRSARRRRLARPGDDARAAPRLRRPARPGARRRRPSRRRSRRRASSASRSVVKTAAPGAHKTETGGVALDLARRGRQCGDAAERIGGPVVVQPMLEGGAELLAGVVQDPVFGPLVAFGPGGVFAELIGEAAFRIAPLTDVDAEELVRRGKAGRLVAGFRGAPPADAAALERPRPPARAPRRGPARGRRARPQPGARAARTAASRSTRACASGGRERAAPREDLVSDAASGSSPQHRRRLLAASRREVPMAHDRRATSLRTRQQRVSIGRRSNERKKDSRVGRPRGGCRPDRLRDRRDLHGRRRPHTVRDSIKQEQIVFGDATDPAVAEHAEQWAGEQVTTGDQARAFALVMREHTLESTGGLTYAQMGRFVSAAKPDDPAGTSDEAAAAEGRVAASRSRTAPGTPGSPRRRSPRRST